MKGSFNAYGERKLIYASSESNVSKKSSKTIDDIIKSDYPKSGLSDVRSALNYAVNRRTVFVVDVKRLLDNEG